MLIFYVQLIAFFKIFYTNPYLALSRAGSFSESNTFRVLFSNAYTKTLRLAYIVLNNDVNFNVSFWGKEQYESIHNSLDSDSTNENTKKKQNLDCI